MADAMTVPLGVMAFRSATTTAPGAREHRAATATSAAVVACVVASGVRTSAAAGGTDRRRAVAALVPYKTRDDRGTMTGTYLNTAILLCPLATGVWLVIQRPPPAWLATSKRSASSGARRPSPIGMGLTVGWTPMIHPKEVAVAVFGPAAP